MAKPDKKQLKLILEKKDNQAFDYVATVKIDAYSMPSKFYATTVFYPATKDETQTFLTTIDATAYFGKEKIGEMYKTDEFDTARAAKKWIKEMFKEFIKILTA